MQIVWDSRGIGGFLPTNELGYLTDRTLGWSADNVRGMVEVTDERQVRITVVEEFSPSLVLHTLSAGIGSGPHQGEDEDAVEASLLRPLAEYAAVAGGSF